MSMFNRSFMSVELVGNLGSDPKSVNTKTGKSMATFTVAITTSSKDTDGNWVNQTQWVGCTTFGGFADRALKALHKGSMVLVKGEPQVRQFQKKDGTWASMLEVIVNDFVVLSTPKRDEAETPQQAKPTAPERPAPVQTRQSAARDAYASEQQAYDDYGTEAF